VGLVPGAHIGQAPAHRPGLPQVAPVTRITRICMIASLFELDCIVKQLGGSGMSRARAPFTNRDDHPGQAKPVARIEYVWPPSRLACGCMPIS